MKKYDYCSQFSDVITNYQDIHVNDTVLIKENGELVYDKIVGIFSNGDIHLQNKEGPIKISDIREVLADGTK